MFRKPVAVHSKKDLGRSASQNIVKLGCGSMLDGDWRVPALVEVSLPRSETVSAVYLLKSENEPIGFKLKDSPTLYPSVYSLWAGSMRPSCIYVNSFTSSFVLGGAHVMLPGVIRGACSPFEAGDIVSVCVVGNPCALAVGVAELSYTTMQSSPSDTKGKAVQVLHYFGDYLWQMGSKSVPDGFGFDRVSAPGPFIQAPVIEPSSSTVPSTVSLTSEETDKLLFVSFLEAVTSLDTEKDYPMDPSSLFSRMQVAAKRIVSEGSKTFLSKHGLDWGENKTFKLDVKNSSYKQMKNFLIFLAERGLVRVKQSGSSTIITSSNLQHPLVIEYRPLPVKQMETAQTEKMVIVNRFVGVNKSWAALLGLKTSDLWNVPEITSLLNIWMRENLLPGPDVVGENPLLSSLFPAQVSKKVFASKFNSDLVPYYSLSTELPPKIRKGIPPVVKVSVKKIQNKKFSTEISNLEKYFLDSIASTLAKDLAVACSNTGVGVIHCQGNVVVAVKKILTELVGIPTECITIKSSV